jgi:hypothetical protein
VIHKAVQDMYLLAPENRRLSNLFLPKKLDRYLSKWIGNGTVAIDFTRAGGATAPAAPIQSQTLPQVGGVSPTTTDERRGVLQTASSPQSKADAKAVPWRI